jgi:hypothetical protein
MKNTKVLLWLLLLPAFSFMYAATVPPMQVTVTNAAGKVLYKGTTTANGTFATGNLEPGNYVVQFDSKGKIAKGAKFALSASAGKYTVSADSEPGEKFVDPGVAMRVTVASSTKITGQVAPAGTLPKQTQAVAGGNTKKWNGPTKIINGKRYIWVVPYTGSVIGGHWVEEGSPEAMQAENGGSIQGTPQPRSQAPMRGGY